MTRVVALALAVCAGCGVDSDPCAGLRDLTQSQAGFALTEAEHPDGWGRTACWQCHPYGSAHQADCIDGVVLDLAALDAERPGDCVPCHGANGVDVWPEVR